MGFTTDLSENMEHFKNTLHVDQCFDVVYRVVEIGGRKGCLFFVDGMTKDEVLLKILQVFQSIKPEDMPADAHGFSKRYIPYGEIGLVADEASAVTQLLSGLTVEIMHAGESSHTDIAICYMRGRVDEKLLSMIKGRIEKLHVDALTMNQESLAECIYPNKWYNPFPKFKFSERPDTAAACLLEGNIVILVDNSPAAMILPSSIFDIIEEADDYYFPPVTGTYLRLSRMLISILTLILTPLWLAFLQNPEAIPSWLDFIRLSDPPHVPVFYQLLILEFAIDGLRLAAINTPSMLTTPLSVIAGIVLGEYSVKSGWFSSETMLYMAFVTVANYSQASFELGYALKFMRVLLLVLTALFNWYGFWLGILISVCAIVFNRTIAGKSYIYPLIPFHLSEVKKRFLRQRLPHTEK